MPLYKRLPHGPHRLGRDEVIRHQRVRIHGAMVEAVAESGYWGTSVRQVIGLAGVSRRSFYEQFDNKQDCFLRTFDVLVRIAMRRVRRSYLSTEGGLEERLRAAFGELERAARGERKAAVLVVLEAQMAGTPGWLRLRRATAACEQLFSRSLIESPEASPLPAPIVRGIAGGLHSCISRWLYEERDHADGELAGEMLAWTLLFQTPAAERMADRIAAQLAGRMRQAAAARAAFTPAAPAGERDLLLENALRLAVENDYRELSAPQIAQEAGVPMERFFALFADRDECFLAGLDALGGELLQIARSATAGDGDWPTRARRAIAEVLCHLAARPLHTEALAREAFAAGPDAVARIMRIAHEVAVVLTDGAPAQERRGAMLEGIGGALGHMVRCQVASGRIQLLPALSDYLAYIVLAPFIGADAAARALGDELPG